MTITPGGGPLGGNEPEIPGGSWGPGSQGPYTAPVSPYPPFKREMDLELTYPWQDTDPDWTKNAPDSGLTHHGYDPDRAYLQATDQYGREWHWSVTEDNKQESIGYEDKDGIRHEVKQQDDGTWVDTWTDVHGYEHHGQSDQSGSWVDTWTDGLGVQHDGYMEHGAWHERDPLHERPVNDLPGLDYTFREPTVIDTVQGPAFDTAFDEANIPLHERPIKDVQEPPYDIADLVDEQSGTVAPVPVGGEELAGGNANGIPGEYGDGPDLDGNGVPDEIGINPDNRQPGYDDPGEAVIVDPADEVALNPQPLPPRPDEYVMHEAVIVDPGSAVGLNPQPLPPDPFDSTLADDAEITDQSYSDLSLAETAVPMPGPNASLGFA